MQNLRLSLIFTHAVTVHRKFRLKLLTPLNVDSQHLALSALEVDSVLEDEGGVRTLEVLHMVLPYWNGRKMDQIIVRMNWSLIDLL